MGGWAWGYGASPGAVLGRQPATGASDIPVDDGGEPQSLSSNGQGVIIAGHPDTYFGVED